MTPLALDVTDPASVSAAAAAAPDVDLVVNNAGIARMTRLSDGDLDDVPAEPEVLECAETAQARLGEEVPTVAVARGPRPRSARAPPASR